MQIKNFSKSNRSTKFNSCFSNSSNLTSNIRPNCLSNKIFFNSKSKGFNRWSNLRRPAKMLNPSYNSFSYLSFLCNFKSKSKSVSKNFKHSPKTLLNTCNFRKRFKGTKTNFDKLFNIKAKTNKLLEQAFRDSLSVSRLTMRLSKLNLLSNKRKTSSGLSYKGNN